jgi:sodium/hydrogen antiporter
MSVTIALGVFAAYALVAGRLDRWSVSAPIVLVSSGIVLGEGGLKVLHITAAAESVRLLAELTLALLLFADASTIRVREAGGDVRLPGRLLGVGLPLTIALGTVLAYLVLPVSWAEAALMASLLAPTDAALGLAVVTNPAVPARIRRALNIESGLNDGIATPLVVFFLGVVSAEAAHQHWVFGALKEISIAAAFGVGLGAASGWLAARAREAGWTTPLSDALVVLSVALIAYEGAVAMDANGFVSAFVAGILFGSTAGKTFHTATEFTEDIGLFGSFAVWVIFGALFAGPVLRDGVHARPVLYAVLSLTVIRMVPVAMALLGLRLRRDTVGFIGWFGPRGLASVVFTLLVYEGLHGGTQAHAVAEVATWTIVLSVFAHGLSAGPLAAAYGRSIGRAPAGTPELDDAAQPRVRRRSLHERPRHRPQVTDRRT